MKLYLLQGIDVEYEYGNIDIIYLFCNEPTLKNLQTIFNKYDISNEDLNKLIQGYDIKKGNYIYRITVFNLNNKEILANMDEEIRILTYTDRVSLGCNIENIITEDIITENMINEQAISDIRDMYDKNEYNSEEEAVKELLEGNSVWLKEYNGIFEWHTINTKNIK